MGQTTGIASTIPGRSLNADQTDPLTPGSHATVLLTNHWNEPTGEDIVPINHHLPGETMQLVPFPGIDTKKPALVSPTQVPEEPSSDPLLGPDTFNYETATREQLIQKIHDQQARIQEQTGQIAIANTESQFFHQRWEDLHLSNEALGQDALTGDLQDLEDRLVQAVKEDYQSEMQRRQCLKLLDRIKSYSKELIATAPHFDPALRGEYEASCRAADEVLAGKVISAVPIAASLDQAQIVDVKPELRAVILNVGKAQGVVEGMPFIVSQHDVPVGVVKVIMVRSLVCEALVQNLQKNTVLQAGDRVAVDAR